MKSKSSLPARQTSRQTSRRILAGSIAAACAATFLIGPASQGAPITWDATAGGAINDGAGAWLGAGQWNNGAPSATWTSGDDAIFGVGGTGGAVTLASPTVVNSLTLNTFTGTYTLGTAAQTMTLTAGITMNAGAGAVSIISPITLGGVQSWTNNSVSTLTSSGGMNLNGSALTIDGTGTTDLGPGSGGIITGAGGIIKNGTGRLVFSSAGTAPLHNFTGGVTINGGVIAFQSSADVTGHGNVTLNGGYLAGRFGSSPTWAGGLGTGATQIRIAGGTSGFSGEGTTSSVFQIGTALSTLQWGSANFNPTVLLLGGAGGNNNGVGSLNNGIDLNGSDRTITSTLVTNGAATSGFTVTGVISNSTGTAGFEKLQTPRRNH